jgi:hypothetical protein
MKVRLVKFTENFARIHFSLLMAETIEVKCVKFGPRKTTKVQPTAGGWVPDAG